MSRDPYRHSAIERETNGELPAVFENQLMENEKPLWFGRPRQGVYMAPADGLLVPFTLIWGGGGIYVATMTLLRAGRWGFTLLGVAVIVFAVHAIVGRFLWDALERRHTFYCLTTKRILILSHGLARTFRAIDLRRSVDVTLTEHRDGSGTIAIDVDSLTQWFADTSWAARHSGVLLRSVANPRGVFDTIISTQQAMRDPKVQARLRRKRAKSLARTR